jgi:hypothetical protein
MKTCKTCKHAFPMEITDPTLRLRQAKAPGMYNCRFNPPQMVTAMGPGGQINLNSMYPMVNEVTPACSRHVEKIKSAIEN